MAGGGGGGGVVVPVSPRARQPSRGGRRRHKAAACLPLDLVVEIAARSDAATLVRCAATCRGARRRIAEDANLRGRLRLRDTGRFLLPLLRGHLVEIIGYDARGRGERETKVYLVDTTTAADATRLVEATFASAAAEAETLVDPVPVDSRGGLVLVRATGTGRLLLVCNPATGRRLVLPPEPGPFPDVRGEPEQYVLLVGDRDDGEGGADTGAAAAVGRPFQVLKAKLLLNPCGYRLTVAMMMQTFSSEHGVWSPRTEIPIPNMHGRYYSCWQVLKKVLVVGDVVHWLCLTDVGSYVIMLHVRALLVSEMALPGSFPRGDAAGTHSYLLATDSASGSPVVLVADSKNIRLWEQSKRTTTKGKVWKVRPRVVIEREAIVGFNDEVVKLEERFEREEGRMRTTKHVPELVCFGERSGAVLLRTHRGRCLLWLDLQSKKIVRCFSSESDRLLPSAYFHCSYEEDLSSWVPTFSSAAVAI